jgi:beta-aspartyl-peptidase (threonine type)
VTTYAAGPAEWKLVIHGGAGIIERANMTQEQERAYRAGLDAALGAGSSILEAAGSAIDAAEAAVRVLEDDPCFNAGRGAVLTYEGKIELDAAVMEGATRAAGAVTGLASTRHPVSAARAVMGTSHVFLRGRGADAYALAQGLEQVANDWFMTKERRRQLDELRSQGSFDASLKYGTVGAVARDRSGNVAAATSTGGLTAKRWGRIGDSCVIGAGTFADNRSGAVSATGSGEYFLRTCVAHEICARIRMLGETAAAAAEAVLAEVAGLGGSGGVIVVTPTGESAFSFTTPGMYRGEISPHGRSTAIYGDEVQARAATDSK